jgi:hypothetical protein
MRKRSKSDDYSHVKRHIPPNSNIKIKITYLNIIAPIERIRKLEKIIVSLKRYIILIEFKFNNHDSIDSLTFLIEIKRYLNILAD